MRNQLSQLNYQCYRYENFKSRVETMAAQISSAITPLENAVSQMKTSFTYDERSADDGFIQKQIDRLKSLYDFYNSTVLTEVDNKISDLKQQISDLETQADQ